MMTGSIGRRRFHAPSCQKISLVPVCIKSISIDVGRLEMKSDIADGIPCMHSKKKKNIGCITDFCVSRWGQKGRRGSTSPRRSREKRGKYTCYVERALPLAITRHNHDEVEREREREML